MFIHIQAHLKLSKLITPHAYCGHIINNYHCLCKKKTPMDLFRLYYLYVQGEIFNSTDTCMYTSVQTPTRLWLECYGFLCGFAGAWDSTRCFGRLRLCLRFAWCVCLCLQRLHMWHQLLIIKVHMFHTSGHIWCCNYKLSTCSSTVVHVHVTTVTCVRKKHVGPVWRNINVYRL